MVYVIEFAQPMGFPVMYHLTPLLLEDLCSVLKIQNKGQGLSMWRKSDFGVCLKFVLVPECL